MGLPMRGWIGDDGIWVLDGFFAKYLEYLKVSQEGWMIIIYECSYFRVLFRFLRGDYVVKKEVEKAVESENKFLFLFNFDFQLQTELISILFLIHTFLN
ncbi:hypothetical protein DLM76_20530 [Leptospira yasudae]|nr:hypothetical protein DLM76_20530 [Leptospira yasudae]